MGSEEMAHAMVPMHSDEANNQKTIAEILDDYDSFAEILDKMVVNQEDSYDPAMESIKAETRKNHYSSEGIWNAINFTAFKSRLARAIKTTFAMIGSGLMLTGREYDDNTYKLGSYVTAAIILCIKSPTQSHKALNQFALVATATAIYADKERSQTLCDNYKQFAKIDFSLLASAYTQLAAAIIMGISSVAEQLEGESDTLYYTHFFANITYMAGAIASSYLTHDKVKNIHTLLDPILNMTIGPELVDKDGLTKEVADIANIVQIAVSKECDFNTASQHKGEHQKSCFPRCISAQETYENFLDRVAGGSGATGFTDRLTRSFTSKPSREDSSRSF